MRDFGPRRIAPRGRPKKRPDYDREEEINTLLHQAAALFSVRYDDRDERPPDAPSIVSVAKIMKISRFKARKLLITAGYYSSAESREIKRLFDNGLSIDQICEKTGLKRQTVNSLLPYSKGAYNLNDPPQFAESCRLYRKRKQANAELAKHLDDPDLLWNAILAFEQYSFRTKTNKRIKYKVTGDQICFGNKTYNREEIEKSYQSFLLKGEGCTYSEELYTVFLRIGACRN